MDETKETYHTAGNIMTLLERVQELQAEIDAILRPDEPQLGDVKLSHKQLQRLTPAERAEYARNRARRKSKHRP